MAFNPHHFKQVSSYSTHKPGPEETNEGIRHDGTIWCVNYNTSLIFGDWDDVMWY